MTSTPISEPAQAPAPPPVLEARDLTVGYGDRAIVRGVSTQFAPGKVTSIIGPNGCGKSTLLKALSRHLAPQSGSVSVADRDIKQFGAKELARIVGMLPQTPIAPDGIAVADLVGRGRTPHQGFFGRWGAEDYRVVAQSLEATGLGDLAERPVDELSGGQRQRAWIAMALAQRTPVLLLDEPTTYLDLKHQVEVLDLLTDLNRSRGTTIVMVLHDLNLAARYSDQLLAMRGGQILASGAPGEVVTEDTLRDVFDLEARVIEDPVSGTPAVMPVGRWVGGAAEKKEQRPPTLPHAHRH